MVINTDSFAVSIIPGEIPSGFYDTVSMKLSGYLGINKDEIDKNIKRDEKDFSTLSEKKDQQARFP